MRGTFARDVELDYRGATTDPSTGDKTASGATGEKLVGADASVQLPKDPYRGMTGYGHYRETYVTEDGAWRIKTLRLTRLRLDFIPA